MLPLILWLWRASVVKCVHVITGVLHIQLNAWILGIICNDPWGTNAMYCSRPHRVSALTWSPTDSWTLATASDSDSSPEVQIWDLRNQAQPKAALRGHSAGVLALSWCQQDATYLLSSAKDNRCPLIARIIFSERNFLVAVVPEMTRSASFTCCLPLLLCMCSCNSHGYSPCMKLVL